MPGRTAPRTFHLGFLRPSWNQCLILASSLRWAPVTSKEQHIIHLRSAVTPPSSTELTSLQPGLSRSSMLLACRGCPALTGMRTTLSPTTTWNSEIKCNLDLCNYPIKWSNVTFLENYSNACSRNGTQWIYLQTIHTPALFARASAKLAWVQDFTLMDPLTLSTETWDHEIDTNFWIPRKFGSSKSYTNYSLSIYTASQKAEKA